jgi:hypothetical protein
MASVPHLRPVEMVDQGQQALHGQDLDAGQIRPSSSAP